MKNVLLKAVQLLILCMYSVVDAALGHARFKFLVQYVLPRGLVGISVNVQIAAALAVPSLNQPGLA